MTSSSNGNHVASVRLYVLIFDIVWIFLFPLLYLIGAHYGAGH